MDERTLTLTALKGSIAKWEHRAQGNFLEASISNCPLCHLFNTSADGSDDDCIGCPVYERTEKQYCEGTPCERYFKNEKAPEVAAREVDFLKSLLPSTGETDPL